MFVVRAATSEIKVDAQFDLAEQYQVVELGVGYRLDLVAEGAVVVEVKSVKEFLPIHDTYRAVTDSI